MIREPRIALFDLVLSLGTAVDLVSPLVAENHMQVSYIAFRIGNELGMNGREQEDLVLAGMLHDIGALSLKERLDILNFDYEDKLRHTEKSYRFLKNFEPFSRVADIIRYHHVPWDNGAGQEYDFEPVPLGSHILNLADRVGVLLDRRIDILDQAKVVCGKIERHTGSLFSPQLVEAFTRLSCKEYFWFDVISPRLGDIMARQVNLDTVVLDLKGLLSMADLFSTIIDFRSKFTATHSCGVAALSESLAMAAGFSERECSMIKVAGYLHDLGKLAVPREILEKPGKLTEKEFDIIRAHPYHTFRTLEPIEDLDVINCWSAFHHERLDGSGYPFHHNACDLSIGSRIVAVADVCSALMEDRPYRKGFSGNEMLALMREMAGSGKLDRALVSLLTNNFADLNSRREAAMASTAEDYRSFSRA